MYFIWQFVRRIVTANFLCTRQQRQGCKLLTISQYCTRSSLRQTVQKSCKMGYRTEMRPEMQTLLPEMQPLLTKMQTLLHGNSRNSKRNKQNLEENSRQNSNRQARKRACKMKFTNGGYERNTVINERRNLKRLGIHQVRARYEHGMTTQIKYKWNDKKKNRGSTPGR